MGPSPSDRSFPRPHREPRAERGRDAVGDLDLPGQPVGSIRLAVFTVSPQRS